MPEQGTGDIVAHFGDDRLWRLQRYKASPFASGRGSNIPSWRRWICATTNQVCWRYAGDETAVAAAVDGPGTPAVIGCGEAFVWGE